MTAYTAPGIISYTPLNILKIVNIVAHHFDISVETIYSKSRKDSIKWYRYIVMYLARNCAHIAYEKIAQEFGFDHTTVISAIKATQDRIDTESDFDLSKLMQEVKIKTLGL